MIGIMNLGKITGNGTGSTKPISGEILKIVIITELYLPNVKVSLKSIDEELLCDDWLNSTKTKFYPKNTIGITQEQFHVENYFIFGPLIFEIEGLGDGESIENIEVYYKQ